MGGPGPCVDHSLRNRLNFRVPRVSKVDYVSPQLRTAYATSGSCKGTQLVRHSGVKQERLGRSPYDTSCVKICLPGNWAGSKQGLLQPVITHFSKYPPLSPAVIRKADWIRCNNYPYFWRILSSHVTVSILVWISYISLHCFNKRKIETFRNLETIKGTLVHSPALGRLLKDFGDATECSGLMWNRPPCWSVIVLIDKKLMRYSTHRRSWFTTWSRLTLKKSKTILEIGNLLDFCVQVAFQTLTFGPGLPIGPRSPFAPIKPWRYTNVRRKNRTCMKKDGSAFLFTTSEISNTKQWLS